MTNIRCVVACHNASGMPCFYGCKVDCDDSEYQDGYHYELALRKAKDAGYDVAQYVVYDEIDGPDFLFQAIFAPFTPEHI